jgi:hypothetical protein
MKLRTGFALFRIEPNGCILWIRRWTFGFHKRQGICWRSQRLSASQIGLASCKIDGDRLQQVVSLMLVEDVNKSPFKQQTVWWGLWCLNEDMRQQKNRCWSIRVNQVHSRPGLGRPTAHKTVTTLHTVSWGLSAYKHIRTVELVLEIVSCLYDVVDRDKIASCRIFLIRHCVTNIALF